MYGIYFLFWAFEGSQDMLLPTLPQALLFLDALD